MVRAGRLIYLPINTQVQNSVVYKLQKASVDLQDYAIDLDSVTEIEDDSIFTLDWIADRPYEKDYHA